jgi:hypothetical protein
MRVVPPSLSDAQGDLSNRDIDRCGGPQRIDDLARRNQLGKPIVDDLPCRVYISAGFVRATR